MIQHKKIKSFLVLKIYLEYWNNGNNNNKNHHNYNETGINSMMKTKTRKK